MAGELSPQTEAFISDALSLGIFPSREALLNAAVDSLRGLGNAPRQIPAAHRELIESGLRQLRDGLGEELSDEQIEALIDQGIAEAARGRQP